MLHRKLMLKQMRDPLQIQRGEASLADINFTNMVNFFSNELTLIHNGEKSSKFFNDNQRRKLKELGILEQVYGYGGCRLILSKKATKLLKLEEKN